MEFDQTVVFPDFVGIVFEAMNRDEPEFKLDPCAYINFNRVVSLMKSIDLGANIFAVADNRKIQNATTRYSCKRTVQSRAKQD